MCTRPVKLINPTRSGHAFARPQLYVPCGKCEDCRSNQSSEWFLRTYAEIEDYVAHGGCCVYCTFTYRPSCLPVFEAVVDGKSYEIPCFNKSDVSRCLNSLIRRLSLDFAVSHNKFSRPVRYIWCCEYGMDNKYTHRPHYHALLFFPKEIYAKYSHPDDMKGLISRYWHYGMCRWSDEVPGRKKQFPIFVTSEFAALYVTKYVCKDVAFYDQPAVKEFLFNEDGTINKERYALIKDKLPRHWQSNSFGLSLRDRFKTKEDFENGIVLNLQSDLDRGMEVRYKAPRYIERKVLYNKPDDKGRFFLNPLGIEVKSSIFERQIHSLAKKYESFDDMDVLRQRLDGYDFIEAGTPLSCFKDLNEVYNYIHEFLHNTDSVSVALFNRVWSGSLTYDLNFYLSVGSADFQTFYDWSIDKYIYDLYLTSDDLEFVEDGYFNHPLAWQNYDSDVFRRRLKSDTIGTDLSSLNDFHKFNTYKAFDFYYFDNNDRFAGFTDFLDVFQHIQSFYRTRCHLNYLEKRHNKQKVLHSVYSYSV